MDLIGGDISDAELDFHDVELFETADASHLNVVVSK